MKRFAILCLVAAFIAFLWVSTARAADDAAALYKSKCVSCHAADGSGSPAGKKMNAPDLRAEATQAKADAELVNDILDGEKPIHKFGKKGVTEEQAKALVALIRTFKAK